MRALICVGLALLAGCSSAVGDAERSYEHAETLGEKCAAATELARLYIDGPEDRHVYWKSFAGIDCARAQMEGVSAVDDVTIVG